MKRALICLNLLCLMIGFVCATTAYAKTSKDDGKLLEAVRLGKLQDTQRKAKKASFGGLAVAYEEAAKGANDEIKKFILSRCIEAQGSKDRALYSAAKTGHVVLVKALVEDGANVNYQGSASIWEVSESFSGGVYSKRTTEKLVPGGHSVLSAAVLAGEAKCVELLVSLGAKKDLTVILDDSGRTVTIKELARESKNAAIIAAIGD